MDPATRQARVRAIIDLRPDETDRSHMAFLRYLEVRDIPAMAAEGSGAISSLYKWAQAHDWQQRAADYDNLEVEIAIGARAELRRQALQVMYDGAPEAAAKIMSLCRGESGEDEKASVSLQAAIHVLAQCGLVPPKRTELTVREGPSLEREASAMRRLDLDTLRRLASPPDDSPLH